MVDWYRAREQFNADMPDGSQQTVTVGEVLPADHVLVKRDLDAAASAVKDGRERLPLFVQLETEQPAAVKARTRTGKGGT